MPDLAEAVLEGSVLLQSISDLSNLTGLRLFSSLRSEKSKRICLLASFLHLENSRPCGSYGGRGMQQASPTCSAHVHPQCCLSAGSGWAVLLATVPGLAGTGGSSPPLTKCFRPHSQNNFDILGKERNLTRHCAWLAKVLLTA